MQKMNYYLTLQSLFVTSSVGVADDKDKIFHINVRKCSILTCWSSEKTSP
jgi:hypothetical protein